MTQIDFYITESEHLPYAARLIRKAYQQNRQILIALDMAELATFDSLLWTFSEADFLPHEIFGETATSPILLIAAGESYDEAIKFPHYDLLVNLSAHFPPQFAAFTRLCEVISAAHLNAGRERYGFYKKRGYALTNTTVG